MGGKCEIHYCDKNNPLITYPNWMKYLNDEMELKDLTIPGTHNSCALKGIFFAVNQSWSLEQQLNAGIRFFDIRLRLFYNSLRAYHGPIDQKMNFSEIIYIFSFFLKKHPSEFILMSVQKEYDDLESNRSIQEIYKDYIKDYQDIIINYQKNLYNEKVKDLRGKIIFFDSMGKRLDLQSGFSAQNKWIVNSSADIDTKKKYIKQQFNRAIIYNEDINLYMNYISGSSDYLFVSPALIAYYTNKLVLKYEGRMGIVLCDYPGEGLIYHLISQNFSKDFSFEKIAVFNPLEINSDNFTNFILENIKYKNNFNSEEKEIISFNKNVSFFHVDTFKYLAVDDKGNLICQKEKFVWLIELIGKAQNNGKDCLEKNDNVCIKSDKKTINCIIHKLRDSNKIKKSKTIFNCDTVALEENNSYFYTSFFQKVKGTHYQSVTKSDGHYIETEFLITIC